MYKKKLLTVSIGLGLAILSWGKVTFAQLNKSTLTTGISVTNAAATTVNGLRTNFNTRRETGIVVETIDGVPILISPEVFETIITGEATEITEQAPEQIVICLSDACGSGNSLGSKTISINNLAQLIVSDLNQALTNLVAAEQATSDGIVAADNSRNIVRRKSSAHEACGCTPGEITIVREFTDSNNSNTISQNDLTVAEARQIVETKLEESSDFIEQINQLKPENSLW